MTAAGGAEGYEGEVMAEEEHSAEEEWVLGEAERLVEEAGGSMTSMLFGRRWKLRHPHAPLQPFLAARS